MDDIANREILRDWRNGVPLATAIANAWRGKTRRVRLGSYFGNRQCERVEIETSGPAEITAYLLASPEMVRAKCELEIARAACGHVDFVTWYGWFGSAERTYLRALDCLHPWMQAKWEAENILTDEAAERDEIVPGPAHEFFKRKGYGEWLEVHSTILAGMR